MGRSKGLLTFVKDIPADVLKLFRPVGSIVFVTGPVAVCIGK